MNNSEQTAELLPSASIAQSNMLAEVKGHCRLKDNVWWYCEYGKARGAAIKGFSRRIIYKWKILNDAVCKRNGQIISVVQDGKSKYCVVI